MSEKERINLILLPGFSTAKKSLMSPAAVWAWIGQNQS
jgi:hypothetical protein